MLDHVRIDTGIEEAPPKDAVSAPDGFAQSTVAEQPGGMFNLPPLPPGKRQQLRGGVYSPSEALKLLNSHYLIGKSEQEVAIFRVNNDGSLAYAPPEQFKLDVANIFVQPSGGSGRPIPAEKFWKEHPWRHQRTIVFKPGGTTDPLEFNLWRGYGVEPRKGWQKQRRLLQHILKIICRRDKAKFLYLIRWLAWAVQNPDKHSQVVVVLKSRKQGTGKSTVGVVMLKIFGSHGALVDDKDRLLGRFNDWLETGSFVLGEEIMWAGDPKSTDKLKSMITANTLQVERKHGAIRQITNRLHPMMTTNHVHAVAAGVGDRRNVVFDVSDERACDKSWFDPLYRDLEAGGFSEFLWLLQNLRLGDWHPRQILKTAEATEQQRMSADSVSQWARACIEADAIIGNPQGLYAATHDLGTKISSEALREAYTGYCKQQSLRAADVGPARRAPRCSGHVRSSRRNPIANAVHMAMPCLLATSGKRRSMNGWGSRSNWRSATLAPIRVSHAVPLRAATESAIAPATTAFVSLSHLSHLI